MTIIANKKNEFSVLNSYSHNVHIYIFFRFFIWGCRNVSAIYGWKYIVTGKRHIQTDDPIIAVVNHQSGLDLLCEYYCGYCDIKMNESIIFLHIKFLYNHFHL